MTDDVVRLTRRDLPWASAVLGRAFMNDPMLWYIIPEEHRRLHLVPWFVKTSLAYGCLYGEAYTIPSKAGVAFFLPPDQTTLTVGRMFKAGMLAAPIKLGLKSFRRFMKMAEFTDKLHKQYAPIPHYYLFGMGVEPTAQGQGIGSRLLHPLLQRSDAERIPCYLETQNERNIRFYAKHGFQVVVEAMMPDGGFRNWGMFRAPHR